MALFQDFSFSASSERNDDERYIDPSDPRDLSPRSSRSTSPFSASPATLSPSQSYIDLSHPVSPFPPLDLFPSHEPTTSFFQDRRDRAPEHQRRHAQDYFATVRARRQSAVRLQCDPKRAASIRNYVERFLNDLGGTPNSPTSSRHPSFVESHIPPPTSAPSEDASMHTMEFGSEDDEEAEAMQALSLNDDTSGDSGVRRISAGSLGLANGRRRRSYAVQKRAKGQRTKAGERF